MSDPLDAAGGGSASLRDHVADLADAGVAAERKGLAPHHLDPVVLLRVVRRRDLDAAVVTVPGDGEVHHVGRHHPVVDDARALFARTFDEGRGHRRRRQPHVATDGNALRVQVADEGAADEARAVLVDF